MRFLIDNALSPRVAEAIKAAGFDAVHVRDQGLSAASDSDIFAWAAREKRVIVSADTDFAYLLATQKTPLPSVILFRRGAQRIPTRQSRLLLANLPAIKEELEAGCIVVIEEDRIRLRKLPISE